VKAARGDGSPGRPQTLAERLDLLFRTRHAQGKPEPTYQEVADEIAEAGGPSVGAAYLYMLRTGRRTSPRVELLTALARYFQVPASYLLGEDGSAQISDELELLLALRDSDVRQLALRSRGLSPESRKAIAAMVEQLRQVEGLPPDDSSDSSDEK
jgi:transcriptional regulator with XRE-family HTH domain